MKHGPGEPSLKRLAYFYVSISRIENSSPWSVVNVLIKRKQQQ